MGAYEEQFRTAGCTGSEGLIEIDGELLIGTEPAGGDWLTAVGVPGDRSHALVQRAYDCPSGYRAAVDAGRSTTERLERHAAWASFARAATIFALPYRDHPEHRPEWSPHWLPTAPTEDF